MRETYKPPRPKSENGVVAIAVESEYLPNEAADDPHRLGRLVLSPDGCLPAQPTLRFWQGQWYRWKKSAYQQVEVS